MRNTTVQVRTSAHENQAGVHAHDECEYATHDQFVKPPAHAPVVLRVAK